MDFGQVAIDSDMKIQYTAKVDALYIEFRPLPPGTAENRPLSEDVIADYGPDGKIAGIEILDVSVVLGEDIQRLVVEVTPVITSKNR